MEPAIISVSHSSLRVLQFRASIEATKQEDNCRSCNNGLEVSDREKASMQRLQYVGEVLCYSMQLNKDMFFA